MRRQEQLLRSIIRSVITESERSRVQNAYDRARQLGSSSSYAEERIDYTNPENYKKDFPEGLGSVVPAELTAQSQEGGQHLLQAWKENADEAFFKGVTKVHWLGFSSRETRTAAGALDDFLKRATEHSSLDLSTIGYLRRINPGPRAGAAFRDGEQGNQVQLGVEIMGDTTYATTHDAFTTNPTKKPRPHMYVNPDQSPYTVSQFKKTPRPRYTSLFDIGKISDKNDPLYNEEIHAEWLEAWQEAEVKAKNDPQSPIPGRHMDPKWFKKASPRPDIGNVITPELMVDKASWREPFTTGPFHNEVVVENWSPAAVYLNPESATHEQIVDIMGVAKKHGIPLLDLDKNPIDPSDYETAEGAAPKRKKVVTHPTSGRPLHDPERVDSEWISDEQGKKVLQYRPIGYKLTETRSSSHMRISCDGAQLLRSIIREMACARLPTKNT